MLFVEPKIGKHERARAKPDAELKSLFEIFKPSRLSEEIIENIWLASAKDFELSLSRLFEFTEENDHQKKQEALKVARAAEQAKKSTVHSKKILSPTEVSKTRKKKIEEEKGKTRKKKG